MGIINPCICGNDKIVRISFGVYDEKLSMFCSKKGCRFAGTYTTIKMLNRKEMSSMKIKERISFVNEQKESAIKRAIDLWNRDVVNATK